LYHLADARYQLVRPDAEPLGEPGDRPEARLAHGALEA
jgi:hypothetical protein